MSEEKKITLEDLEELLEDDASTGGRSRLNFQTIFAALVLNWHWFLMSLIIFVCGALIYLRYAEPVYKVSARMLIKDQNRSRGNAAQALASVEDLGFLSNSSGIDNEVEVLQSSVLLCDVVKDLKLYTEYRREDVFIMSSSIRNSRSTSTSTRYTSTPSTRYCWRSRSR